MTDISDNIVVIKYGGHAMTDENLKKSFSEDINSIKKSKLKPVIVHGGGPQINSLLKKLNITSNFINGMRITDKAVMNAVEMALCGSVNKEVVANINKNKEIGFAAGISGKDANLIIAEKLNAFDDNNNPVDIGFVGKVKKVHTKIIYTLLESGFIPVIAPVSTGYDGKTYNINADVAAAAIASALFANSLIFITDVDGVMDSSGNLIPCIYTSDIKKMIENKIVTGGMIPKIKYAMNAVKNGAKKVRIINGKKDHALSYALQDEKIGTTIKEKQK
jgi:acetylglutamate kinase